MNLRNSVESSDAHQSTAGNPKTLYSLPKAAYYNQKSWKQFDGQRSAQGPKAEDYSPCILTSSSQMGAEILEISLYILKIFMYAARFSAFGL